MFLQGKVNGACYIARVVNPVLLPFLWQEGDVLFSRKKHVHIWLLRYNMLFVVYNNCPGQQEPHISCQLNTYGTWWSGNLLFFLSLPQPLPNCNNGCKMLGTVYCRMAFGTFMTVCMREYLPVLLPECVHCVLMWLFGHPLLWLGSIWSEFVIIYSYNDKLCGISICYTMNLSLRVLHFFLQCT